jgi:hypothetical protein
MVVDRRRKPLGKAVEVVYGFGHENVLATHSSTVEFTRDFELSKNGDCIVAVSLDRTLAEFSQEFKSILTSPRSKLIVKIQTDKVSDVIRAFGSPLLSLSSTMEIVIRKSDFVSDRTVGVRANKAAVDLSRELVEKLKNPRQKVKITFTTTI